MKKEYVHIKEYLLTKLIMDRLEIDIEDDFELCHEFASLHYKDKQLVLPSYKEYNKYDSTKFTAIRPFINVSHIQFLIDFYSDKEDKDILFEYSNNKNEGLYDGIFYIKDKKQSYEVKLYAVRNIPVLMSGLLLKTLCGYDLFTKNINDIFLVDKKMKSKK